MTPAARPSSPRLADRFDRRQEDLVRRAARVFASRGYDQTTIQELSVELDLAAGGIYHYVGSKERLLALICDQLMDPLLAAASELLSDSALDPVAALSALTRLWVGHVAEHRDHMLVFQQERHVIEHGSQWKDVRASRKGFERLIEGVLTDVHGLGRLVLEDDRLTLVALLGMVNHTAQWYRPRGRLTPEEIADGYVRLLVSG